jgi:maltose alpha-D-glucosyltransferase/alpha-amylase
LSEKLREILGAPLAEGARQIGEALAAFHQALASTMGGKDFAPENFSLHYQRSLYAGLQTLVRSTFDELNRKIDRLPENTQAEARSLLQRKNEVLGFFKKIYSKKLDIVKTRIHGHFSLEQVLFTGRDVSFPYLGGDPGRPFSERRLKRSPFRDIAAMIRSFYYVAQHALRNDRIKPEDLPVLTRWYKLWTHYATNFFMEAYLATAATPPFIPADKDEFATLLHIYLLEIALQDLQDELDNRPEWVTVPLHLVLAILDEE